MRKVLVVALLAVFLIGITGLLTVADVVNENNVIEVYDDPADAGIDAHDYPGLSESELEDVDKVIIVTPEHFDGENYDVKATGSKKVLVAVDPIHVIK